MHTSTYFDQECPICGRRLQVRVAYLGRRVACQHCRGEFEAFDSQTGVCLPSESGIAMMRRAGQLLGFAKDEKS